MAATTILVAGAAEAAVPATAAPWSRTVNQQLPAAQLHLAAASPPRALARAAIQRSSKRLGLQGSPGDLRLAAEQTLPRASGARDLRVLRFQQTVGGLRVLWSKIDVAVVGKTVTSIGATTVPLARHRLLGIQRVSAGRARAIARHAVTGSQAALPAQPVAYAGNPKNARAPRRAWVVQVTAGRHRDRDESSERTICVVVDAQTGRILTKWEGTAAPAAAADGRGGRTAHAAAEPTTAVIVDGSGANGPGAPWALLQDPNPFTPANLHTHFFTTPNQSDPGLLNVVFGTFDTTRFMCSVRLFCGRDGGSNGQYVQFEIVGRSQAPGASFYTNSTKRIELKPSHSDDWDALAHELGHLIDFTRANDRSNSHQMVDEVEEALADMFAFDYDRDDPTMFDDAEMKINFDGDTVTNGSRDLRSPGRFTNKKVAPTPTPYPSTMCGYRNNASDAHFNATILGHAYYLFVDAVGHDRAGAVLHSVPGALPPAPTFEDVRAWFVQRADELYGSNVRAAAESAFTEARIGPGVPACFTSPPTPSPCHHTPTGFECDAPPIKPNPNPTS